MKKKSIIVSISLKYMLLLRSGFVRITKLSKANKAKFRSKESFDLFDLFFGCESFKYHINTKKTSSMVNQASYI